jgi:hypothetical protein
MFVIGFVTIYQFKSRESDSIMKCTQISVPKACGRVCLMGTLLLTSAALADGESPILTVGAKAWVNTWTSWGLDQKSYNNASNQVVIPINSGTQASWIPTVSVGYGKWVVAASYMIDTRYLLVGAEPAGPLTGVSATRTETDASLGYALLPGLALTAGYKELKQEYGDTYKWSGPVVGLNASVPMPTPGLNLYGTFGYGFFTVDLPADAPDASKHTSLDATYIVSEFGISYAIGRTASGRRPVTLTAGYRTQTVKTRNYGLAVTSDANVQSQYTTTDLRDITQGFTLGIRASF